MSDPRPAPLPPETSAAGPPAPWWQPLWERRSLVGLSLLALGALVIFRCVEGRESAKPAETAARAAEVVRVAGPGLLEIDAGSSLETKLTLGTVKADRTEAPLLSVTGSVVARLSAGADDPQARWDFSQPDLASAWSDLLRARTEEPFAQQQLVKTRQLVAARTSAQTKVVDRLRQLVAAGTDSPRDLAAAEADLVQAQLEGQKQVFEAETAQKNAERTRTALERQLLQAGVDPALLARSAPGTAVVVADVPESKSGLVKQGQACSARFYALPGEVFPATVRSVAATLSSERRTLRVFFEIADPGDRLRPGLFAEVGLGTDPRDAVLVSADALLHVGRADYVLVRAAADRWRVTEVQAGEMRGTDVEILAGASPGETVIESGAILLKPLVVQSLRP